MGFFSNAFSKKSCDICDGNMGIVTDNKCADGKFCHTCAGKLSPWYKGARQASLDQIKEQMNFRETVNKPMVEAFSITRSLGNATKVLLDENAGKFMVTRASDWKNANPDVLDFSDVTGVNVKVDESRSEIMFKDKDGNSSSYKPPHYKYEYTISMEILVNNTYFNEIKFDVGELEIEAERTGRGRVSANPEKKVNPVTNFEYKNFMKQANEIKAALEQVRAEARENAAPKQPVICPFCGATTTPDGANCCEYCGGPLG